MKSVITTPLHFRRGGSRMKIHEYQAKEILRGYGIPVPKGKMAETPEEARKVAEEIGGRP